MSPFVDVYRRRHASLVSASGWRTVASACLLTPAFALTVALGWHCSVLDVLSLILWAHAGYTYLITNYGNLAVADSMLW